MKLFFRLPGGDGKRKPSALTGKKDTIFYDSLYFIPITASQSSVLFAHRRLPMGKKGKTLCELSGSVVKYSSKNTSLYL